MVKTAASYRDAHLEADIEVCIYLGDVSKVLTAPVNTSNSQKPVSIFIQASDPTSAIMESGNRWSSH